MALFALLTGFALGAEAPVTCRFKGETPDDEVVAVTLEPVPSLKDRPGLHRVMMEVGGATVRANAQPIATTEEPDVMIRARTRSMTYFTIGLREDGAAAMHVAREETRLTLHGRCDQHEPWFPAWVGGTGGE